jgi:exosortase
VIITKAQRVQYALIAGLLVVMFWQHSHGLYYRWFRESSYYSHGFMIPLISLYLIWRKREELAELPAAPSRLGLVVLLFGACLRLGAAYGKVNIVAGFSLIIILIGLTLLLFGRRVTWKVLFPLAFLCWMVPLPEASITEISFELKTFASEMAARLLPRVGITVERVGSTISFLRPNNEVDKLIIEDVCSGLRSMIALLAFGSLFAYVTSCGTRKKLELFAASVPCSIIANMTRIVFITGVAYFFGSSVATSRRYIPKPFGEDFTIHDATGLMIFVVAFVCFFTYERLLNRSAFRLPKAEGPQRWVYEGGGKLLRLAENQLECLIAAGHIGADDRIRPIDSPTRQRAGDLEAFAGSPRTRKLKIAAAETGSAREVTFEQCIEMARRGELRKDDFVGYAEGTAALRAGNLDFLRPYWPSSLFRKVSYVLLYAALPVALYFVVQSDRALGSLAEGRPGTVLVTVVAWFGVRSLLLLGGVVLYRMRHAEKPMPAAVEGTEQ